MVLYVYNYKQIFTIKRLQYEQSNIITILFSVACEQFATLAGGYSAVLLLPGKDRPSQGSVSMLEGGNWCSRDAHHGMGSLQIEVSVSSNEETYKLSFDISFVLIQ